MKKILPLIATSWALMACDNPVRMETKVHEDGSLDKTIVLEETDRFRDTSNMFGISEKTGWKVKLDTIKKENSDNKYKVQFQKHFTSASEVNTELDKNLDTLFRINTTFEKKFRWFYTYIRYSETIRSIDRFKNSKPDDYFNQEDKAFIDRLSGEGTAISKADSLFLQQLNEKIFDRYAKDAMYNEYFSILTEAISRNTNDKKWIDTLNRKKNFIFEELGDMNDDLGPAFLKLADSLGIPLPKEKFTQDFLELSRDINSRIEFMSFARDGKYTSMVEMPWPILTSNADSVAGNKLFWRPLVTKFTIQPYEMYTESRRLNIWAVAVSALIIVVSVVLVFKSKK